MAGVWANPARKGGGRRVQPRLRCCDRHPRPCGRGSPGSFQRLPDLLDLLLGLRDERVELRDLLRVLPLLVLAEAEQVRLVLRTPAVEEQFVLRDDGLPE